MILCPDLFKVFINDLPEIFDRSCDGVDIGTYHLNCLLYADDVILMSKTETGLQNCISKLGLTLCCFVVYSTRRFVVCLSVCHFVLVFFSPFSIAITSLREERANLSAFRTFVRFVLVWICRFPLPLGVWEGLWFVIVALPGHFSYLFLENILMIGV